MKVEMALSDVHFAARMRDWVRTVVRKELDAIMPPDQFGIVTLLDTTTRSARILLPDGVTSMTVSYGFGVSPQVGDTVRVTGRAGSRYIPGGGGAHASLTAFTVPSQPLATNVAPSSLFTWTEVDIGYSMALIWRMTITSSATENWAFQIYSEFGGAGDEMFAAGGMPDLFYRISWPWLFRNGDTPQTTKMYVGVRNGDPTVNTDFTLTEFEGLALN